ncbi:MAG: hypothetical protein RR293_06455 [Bacteroidales bacterium]
MSTPTTNKDELLWDTENQRFMSYSPFSNRWLPHKISIWDVDKPEYKPSNFRTFQNVVQNNKEESTPNYTGLNTQSTTHPVTTQQTPFSNRIRQNTFDALGTVPDLSPKELYNVPELFDRILDYGKSATLPLIWNKWSPQLKQLADNPYVAKITSYIPNKSIEIKLAPPQKYPRQIKGATTTLKKPTAETTAFFEEITHASHEAYKKQTDHRQPSANDEFELKFIQDIINSRPIYKNGEKYNNKTTGFYNSEKTILAKDDKNVTETEKSNAYFKLIKKIYTQKYITEEDLRTYHNIGRAMDREKVHNGSVYDPNYYPAFLMELFGKNGKIILD